AHLGLAVTDDLAKPLVSEDEPARQVGLHDTCRGLADDGAEALLALAQLIFSPLEVFDIDGRADPISYGARVVHNTQCARVEQAIRAVVVEERNFNAVFGNLSNGRLPDVEDALAAIRMNALRPAVALHFRERATGIFLPVPVDIGEVAVGAAQENVLRREFC